MIEAVDICGKCAGKRAPRSNQSKISTARVVDNSEADRRGEEDAAKGEEGMQRANAKAARVKETEGGEVVG